MPKVFGETFRGKFVPEYLFFSGYLAWLEIGVSAVAVASGVVVSLDAGGRVLLRDAGVGGAEEHEQGAEEHEQGAEENQSVRGAEEGEEGIVDQL